MSHLEYADEFEMPVKRHEGPASEETAPGANEGGQVL